MGNWWEDKTAVIVEIGGLYATRPTYHRARPFDDRISFDPGNGVTAYEHVTRCGLVYLRYGGGSLTGSFTPSVDRPRILLAHAEKIGRPCKRCYP